MKLTLGLLATMALGTCMGSPVTAHEPHHTPSYSVQYDKDTHTATISGGSSAELSAAVRKLFEEEDILTVRMWGEGGLGWVGRNIGELIKAEGASVIIPEFKRCVSSCALSALGGGELLVEGSLWFHNFRFEGIPGSVELNQIGWQGATISILMAKYFNDMGYDYSFMWYLIENTTPTKFAIVRDSAQLFKFRFDPDTTTITQAYNDYFFTGEGIPLVEQRMPSGPPTPN